MLLSLHIPLSAVYEILPHYLGMGDEGGKGKVDGGDSSPP
jgi:hypothetical protein